MRGERGTVLIFVLWVVVLMSLMSLSVGITVRQSVKAAQKFDTREELRLVGESCVKKAMAILNSKPARSFAADSLHSQWNDSPGDFKDVKIGRGVCSVMHENPGRKVSPRDGQAIEPVYGVIDENRKLNINRIKSYKILTRFFQTAAFLDEKEAYALAVSVMDWVDEDDHPYDQGAESRYYELLNPPYRSKNALFATLEELMMVKGMTPHIFALVRPYLTVAGTGQININTASPVVLEAVGLERGLVNKLMIFREGFDRKTGTQDDGIFSSLSTAVSDLMGVQPLSDAEKQIFEVFLGSGNLTTQSSTFEIRSIAGMATRTERLEQACIFERHGAVLSWQEMYRSAQS